MSDVETSPAALGRLEVRDIIDWLVGDECHELDHSELTAGFGVRLRTADISLDHFALHLRTLHPLVRARSIAWAPDEAVKFFDYQHVVDSSGLLKNPLHHVGRTREWLTLRRDDMPTKWSMPDVFCVRGLTEIVIAPLLNAGPFPSIASFGTRRPTGFSKYERAVLEAVIPALRSASELKLLRLVETTLLATYLGSSAGQRVLAGHVQRGEVETLEAALMVCDLRGFTDLSNRYPEKRILELLNIYFDQIVPAITETGGEILKFMGDAVLAYFLHEGGAVASCNVAFDAAGIAMARLAAASKDAGVDLRVGIALHYGKVSYGNIGSGVRLDFTVIGRDVNLVSRIQSICAPSGRSLLMSERFAELLAASHCESIGRHELKGFGEPVELFATTNFGDRPRTSAPSPV